MTISEAYELLDLPEGADFQQIRAKFSEQHEEYRMQIDNAPTPNLKQRYEKNLALREEAFRLLTNQDSTDDAGDLPHSGKSDQENRSGKSTQNKSSGLSITEALAYFKVTTATPPAQIRQQYENQKAELEDNIAHTKLEKIKLAYYQERATLLQAWAIIEPWLSSHQQQNNPNWKSKFDTVSETNTEGLYLVKHNHKFGFADAAGNLVIPLKYDEADPFQEGLACVAIQGKYGYINASGKEIISLQYDLSYGFANGLALVELDYKYGSINKNGEVVIPIIYEQPYSFSEDLASVILNEKYGFINRKGQVIIPIKYEYASYFKDGLAEVKLNGKTFSIDKTGTPAKENSSGNNTSEAKKVYENKQVKKSLKFGLLEILLALCFIPFFFLPLTFSVVVTPIVLTVISYILSVFYVNLKIRSKSKLTIFGKNLTPNQLLTDAIAMVTVAGLFSGYLFQEGKTTQTDVLWGCSFESVFLGLFFLISSLYMFSSIPLIIGLVNPKAFKFPDRRAFIRFALYYFLAPIVFSAYILGLTRLIAGSLRGSCL